MKVGRLLFRAISPTDTILATATVHAAAIPQFKLTGDSCSRGAMAVEEGD